MSENAKIIWKIIYDEYSLNKEVNYQYDFIMKSLIRKDIDLTIGEFENLINELKKNKLIIIKDSNIIVITNKGIKKLKEEKKMQPIAYFTNNY